MDEILEEVYRNRDALAREHGYDLDRLIDAVNAEALQAGRTLTTPSPRPPGSPKWLQVPAELVPLVEAIIAKHRASQDAG